MSKNDPDVKYILFHSFGATDSLFFDENARDNSTEPYIALRRQCGELGYLLEVTRDQELEKCEWLIFWNVSSIGPSRPLEGFSFGLKNRIQGRHYRNLYKEAIRAGMSNKMAMILSEPPAVCPQNSNRALHKNFKIVFTWDNSLVDGVKYIRALLPVSAVFPKVERVPFSARKLLTDISGNKYSGHEKELYSARRDVIQFFERNYPHDFDLYGTGWNNPWEGGLWSRFGNANIDRHHYCSYRGTVSNKSEILPKYRFIICYENSEQPDLITNRIFDVFRCNSVPIYWGAPNIADYVDKEALIDRHDFDSNEDLGKYISSLRETEFEKILKAGQDYLNSDRFKPFLSNSWVDLIVDALGLGRTPKESR